MGYVLKPGVTDARTVSPPMPTVRRRISLNRLALSPPAARQSSSPSALTEAPGLAFSSSALDGVHGFPEIRRTADSRRPNIGHRRNACNVDNMELMNAYLQLLERRGVLDCPNQAASLCVLVC